MTFLNAGGRLTFAIWALIAPGSRWARMLPSTAELTVPPTLRQNWIWLVPTPRYRCGRALCTALM